MVRQKVMQLVLMGNVPEVQHLIPVHVLKDGKEGIVMNVSVDFL